MFNSKKNIFLVFLSIFSMSVLIVSISVYIWIFYSINKTVKQINTITSEIKIVSSQTSNIQTLKKAVRDAKKDIEYLETYFIKEDDLVSFLEEIEAIGDITNTTIDIKAVSSRPAIDKDKTLYPLSILIQSKGSLNEITHVLSILETLPVVSSITSTRIVQHPTGKYWTGDFNLEIIKMKTKK